MGGRKGGAAPKQKSCLRHCVYTDRSTTRRRRRWTTRATRAPPRPSTPEPFVHTEPPVPVTLPPIPGDQRSLAFTPQQYVIAENILGNVRICHFRRISNMISKAQLRGNLNWASVWCHRLERPASPRRRICAVTRGFQITTRDLSVFSFLPRHYHMTRVLAVTIHHYCLDTCGPCNN